MRGTRSDKERSSLTIDTFAAAQIGSRFKLSKRELEFIGICPWRWIPWYALSRNEKAEISDLDRLIVIILDIRGFVIGVKEFAVTSGHPTLTAALIAALPQMTDSPLFPELVAAMEATLTRKDDE